MALRDRLGLGAAERPQFHPAERKAEPRITTRVDPNQEIRNRIQERLTRKLNLASDNAKMSEERRDEILGVIDAVMDEEQVPQHLRDYLKTSLFNEIMGFGPIQPLLDDPEISEVMVNGPDLVYVEFHGKLRVAEGIHFRNNEHVLQIIEKIVAPLGRRIDETSPLVDARLPDGSRVNAIIPPLAIDGPSITIRKFARDPITIDDLLKFGSLNEPMALLLQAAVLGKQNIVIAGGTASGKTTLLNVVSSFIPEDERIVTIEDAAELHLQQRHVIRLEVKPPNIEGKGEISMRALVRNSLRMRPDRIVVGEVRTGEALDMLQAMNTGHDGSLTTVHANNPRDTLTRIETMVLMAGMDFPLSAVRQQIASAVHLIVFQKRVQDGTRKITAITEVVGMEGDVITLQDIFRYEQTGIDGDGNVIGGFHATGIRPRCYEDIVSRGIELPVSIFSAGRDGR